MQVIASQQVEGLEHGFLFKQRAYNYAQALNGGLDFGTSTQTTPSTYTGNHAGCWVNITAPASPNTEFAVPHTLGRTPSHLPIINKDRACDVYQLPDTGTVWNQQNIYLKCSVASAKLRIFIS